LRLPYVVSIEFWQYKVEVEVEVEVEGSDKAFMFAFFVLLLLRLYYFGAKAIVSHEMFPFIYNGYFIKFT